MLKTASELATANPHAIDHLQPATVDCCGAMSATERQASASVKQQPTPRFECRFFASGLDSATGGESLIDNGAHPPHSQQLTSRALSASLRP